jgi:hypothetical protein
VVLRDVRNFVRQHRSQFRFALRGDDQTGMHADVAARQGESIERGILHQEKLEILARILAVGHEAVAEGVEVLGDFGIVGKSGIVQADVAHDRLADAAFGLRRQRKLRRVAQIGQPLGQGGRQEQQG